MDNCLVETEHYVILQTKVIFQRNKYLKVKNETIKNETIKTSRIFTGKYLIAKQETKAKAIN